MITGFNTDVQHEGHVYHVQTEDGGQEHPVVESLVYIGGTIIAKKLTPYGDQIGKGATEQAIASMLKRQHQVIIAAIKAGRIEDLIRLSGRERASDDSSSRVKPVIPPAREAGLPQPSSVSGKLGLNLDEVISDYLKRSSEQGKLDIKVLAPSKFIAGAAVALKVQVSRGQAPEPEAVVIVKIIGTAFKPLVYTGKADRSGNTSFNFALPAFTAGTAAMVIEAQSNRGRGELKHLIRRS